MSKTKDGQQQGEATKNDDDASVSEGIPVKIDRNPKQSQWPADLLDLAVQFKDELANVFRSSWSAAKIAKQMREMFPRKVQTGKEGWMKFCKQVLLKDERTVNSYVRGVAYVEQAVPDWERQAKEGRLPPVSLVAELASVRDADMRKDLHDELFSGDYSASDYRAKIAGLKKLDELDGPSNGQSTNEQSDEQSNIQTSEQPKGQTSEQPNSQSSEQPNSQSNGQSTEGRQEKTPQKKRMTDIQSYLWVDLPKLLPDLEKTVPTIKAGNWDNSTELTNNIAGLITALEYRLKNGGIIVIPGRKS